MFAKTKSAWLRNINNGTSNKEFPSYYDGVINKLTAELIEQAELEGCKEIVDIKIDSYTASMVSVTLIAKK